MVRQVEQLSTNQRVGGLIHGTWSLHVKLAFGNILNPKFHSFFYQSMNVCANG